MWAQSQDSEGGREAEAFAAEPSDLVSEVPAWVFFLVALSVGGVLALIITLTILSEGFKPSETCPEVLPRFSRVFPKLIL